MIWMFFVALTDAFRNYSGSSIAYFGAWTLHLLTAVGQASTCCSAAFAQRKATGEMGLSLRMAPSVLLLTVIKRPSGRVSDMVQQHV